MTPPINENTVEEEIEIPGNTLSQKADNYNSDYSTLKGIYFLLFIVLLFALVSLGMFLFETTTFEDQKYKGLQHLLRKHAAK